MTFDGTCADDGTVVKRSDALYAAHPYHTKIPPSAIQAYILRYTKPGDIVLDPFCGSGMTGVAAARTGRRAILGDLSPAAVHIARNYTEPCDAVAFRSAVKRVLARAGSEIRALYTTEHNGESATIESMVWSDVRECPRCRHSFALWDQRHEGLRRLLCPACGEEGPKAAFVFTGEKAVEVNLSLPGRRRITREPREEEARPASLPEPMPWFPTVEFGPNRPMWRRAHADLGIRTVADFFSRRNLAALGLLWDAAADEPDPRLRDALRFSLTAIINRASRRYQWNPKRPTNVLGGTLYVSSLRYEWNVLSLWLRKTRAIERLYAQQPQRPNAVTVAQWSATDLPLPDNSIDYCFTDPPFGGNIVYSDSSLLWESWLGQLTERSQEAIMVNAGDKPKSVDDYETLLEASFSEIRRVLRPEGHATVVFQATDATVWKAIQSAAAKAGLHLEDAAILEKGQPSFKQIKSRSGERVATADVVLTFSQDGDGRDAEPVDPEEALKAELASLGDAGPTLIGRLYAGVNARLLASGAAGVLGFADLEELLRANAIETDAGWVLGV